MAIWKKLLFLTLALLMVCSLAACEETQSEDTKPTLNPGDPGCDHSWTEWDVTRQASCSKNGRQKRLCETCGREEQETLLAWGHIYMDGKCVECDKEVKDCEHKEVYELVLSEADCYEDGESRTVCKKCKAMVEQKITPAFWHPEWDVVKITDPTCSENGVEHLVCKLCQEVIGQNVIDANGHDYLYVEGQDPTCTEPGWGNYKLCTTCGYQDGYMDIYPMGHNFCADTCLNCGEVDPAFEMMDVPNLRDNALVVEQMGQGPADVKPAQVDSFNGDISTGEVWTFHASMDGGYMLWLNKMEAGCYVQMEVFDMSGNRVAYGEEIHGDGGMYVELTEGDYSVKLSYGNALTTYHLRIGHPKEAVDISGQAAIRDQLQFMEQSIVYTYTPAVSGDCSFIITDTDATFFMILSDAQGNELAIDDYAAAGRSVTCYLEAGQTYTLYLQNRYGSYGSFVLQIGSQRTALDVTGYSAVIDCIRHNGDQVTYTFTAAHTYYLFGLQDMTENDFVGLSLYDSQGQRLYHTDWCPNGGSFAYEYFEVGQTYTLVVEYGSDATAYTLFLLSQPETIEIHSDLGIRDEMLISGQTKIYRFTADREGQHRIMLDVRGADGGYLTLEIYDENGVLHLLHYLYDGEYLVLGDMPVGHTYIIQVYQFYGAMEYTLSIQE